MIIAKWLGIGLFGVAFFLIGIQYTPVFLEWARFQSLGTRDYIVDKLNQMFIPATPQQVFLSLIGFSGSLGTIVFIACLPKLLPAIFLGLITIFITWKIPKPIVNHLYQKRIDKFVLQMVDALSLVANGLRSGLSIIQSFDLVIQQMSDPIAQEFKYVLNQNKLGITIETALNELAIRIPSDDVQMFVTSINILRETGGNLAETFDTIIGTIRDRIKVQNKIAALTAQGFYQGIFVIAIPPILGVVFYQSDPEFMRPLFTTLLGWFLIATICLLEVIGFFVIMKVIKIDV